jgi:hypothetical protein
MGKRKGSLVDRDYPGVFTVSGARKLPDYAPLLIGHHAAFETELRAIVASQPLDPGHRILDLACGDGPSESLVRPGIPTIAPWE